MKRLIGRKGWLAAVIFVALVAVSGLALNASGNWSNPFAVFTASAQGERGGEIGAPPDLSATTRSDGTTSTTMPSRPEGGGESSGLSWSQLGSVLYNLWYLFAVSAFVMVISQVGKAVRQSVTWMKQRGQAANPSPA